MESTESFTRAVHSPMGVRVRWHGLSIQVNNVVTSTTPLIKYLCSHLKNLGSVLSDFVTSTVTGTVTSEVLKHSVLSCWQFLNIVHVYSSVAIICYCF